MILPWWAYQFVALSVALAILLVLMSVTRTNRWSGAGLTERLLCLTSVLGWSTAVVYVGVVLRAGMVIFSAAAILRSGAAQPGCDWDCYRLDMGIFIILLSYAWPVPLAGVLGATLLWSSDRQIVRAFGVVLCVLAVAVTIWVMLDSSELLWRRLPPMHSPSVDEARMTPSPPATTGRPWPAITPPIDSPKSLCHAAPTDAHVATQELILKAVVQMQYGLPLDVLAIQEVDTPAYADDEVLVRVHAASIHIGDCHLMKGLPYFLRLFAGLSRPKASVPGNDFAGVVEAVGKDVQDLQAGDEVFGWCTGAFAEYACVPATKLAPKPTGLTFEEASAVGVSAFTALHALRDRAKVQAGQKLLINGASGGVGTFAVQIAKHLGAEVTGVCSTRNVEMVQSIGADHVIDYTQVDFTQGEARYDVILDNVSNHPASAFKRVLTPEGRYQPNGAQPGKLLGGLDRMAKAVVVSLYDKQQGRPFLSVQNHQDLLTLKELVDAGAIQPVIDQTYPLSEAPQALAHVESGHARAKVVIKM